MQRRRWVAGPHKHGRRWRLTIGCGAGRDPKSRERLSYPTREEAEQAKSRIERQIAQEEEAQRGLTWDSMIKEFGGYMAERGCKARSIETTEARLRRFFKPALGSPLQLSEEQADRLYADLRSRPCGTGRPLSVQEQRHCLSRARALGAWLVRRKLWRSNPLAAVEAIGRPRRGKPQLRRDEARRFLAHCLAAGEAGDAGAVAALVALLLGLRASEIAGLVVRDLDDGGRLLWVADSKTAAGVRELQVPDVLRPLLLGRARGKLPAAALFGRDRWWLRREVARLCAAAGVPAVPTHGLRGTHASLARAAGVSPLVLAASLGHAGTGVQDRHYVLPAAAAAGQQAQAPGTLLDFPGTSQAIEKATEGAA